MSCRDREHQLELVSYYFCKSGNVIKIWIIGNKLRIIHIKGKSLFRLISHRRCLGFSFCQICYCTCVPVVLRELNGPNRVDRMTKTVTSHIIQVNASRISLSCDFLLYGCYMIITQNSWVFIVSIFRGKKEEIETTQVRLLTAVVPHAHLRVTMTKTFKNKKHRYAKIPQRHGSLS